MRGGIALTAPVADDGENVGWARTRSGIGFHIGADGIVRRRKATPMMSTTTATPTAAASTTTTATTTSATTTTTSQGKKRGGEVAARKELNSMKEALANAVAAGDIRTSSVAAGADLAKARMCRPRR